ncbi:hypothetical protein QO259_10125 [Salinicola sp. JS01]|uniref:hypothetical protein n=1 Tax=Salinicola sp. JS01 TaxID=3050071 RepID=UPI00255B45EC|nr:hypothetical protein [Salinicola sp. JS01]WIX31196.1 hypothetical protein QO259_10125 [Salinicola sp. JS01]
MDLRNAAYAGNGTIDCEIEHPELGWIPFTASPDDPDERARGIYQQILDSGIEIAPYEVPPVDVEALAASKLDEINRASEADLAELRRQYPQYEIDTWPQQEAEARAWQADNNAHTPTLDGIAARRGIAFDELVRRVIANAEAYRPIVTDVIGKRQRLEDQIRAAVDAGDAGAIRAISWPEEVS